MRLNDLFHRYEGIVLKNSEMKTEYVCEIIPVTYWFLFKTNHGRYFTCKKPFEISDTIDERNWRDVEFETIVEGRAYPF